MWRHNSNNFLLSYEERGLPELLLMASSSGLQRRKFLPVYSQIWGAALGPYGLSQIPLLEPHQNMLLKPARPRLEVLLREEGAGSCRAEGTSSPVWF